jgi:phage baseplate assembly protein gpV
MLKKEGIVCDSKPGEARVFFEEDNLTSDWLQIIYPFTVGNKAHWPIAINSLVGCIMDEHCIDGYILGAVYNTEDRPPIGSLDDVILELSGNSKLGIKKGDDTLKQALTLINEAVTQIVVLYGNNPNYTKLLQAQQIINNILS